MTTKKDKLRYQLRNAIVIVIASWIVIPTIVILFLGKPDNAGTLGDTFGIVNALFSALAFALLIYTSLMQREELELQRKELELTRKELEKSAEAQNTLVNLTREQLELERAIRKKEVKPELIFLSSNWISLSVNSTILRLKFCIKYYKLSLTEIIIESGKDLFKLDDEECKKIVDKYLNPNDEFTLVLVSKISNSQNTNNLKIKICFKDVDGKSYHQLLSFQNDNFQLSNVKGIDSYRIM